MFLDFYRAHFNLRSQTVRNLIDSLPRIRALYFRKRRVRIGFNVSDFVASFLFSYREFDETIDSHLPFTQQCNFREKAGPDFA